MTNKLVNLRLNERLLKAVDEAVKETTYSNRTDLIKGALRKFLDELNKQKALASLKKHYGEGKRLGIKEPTPEEFEKIREEVWNEKFKEKGLI